MLFRSEKLLPKILDKAFELVGADRGAILLMDDRGEPVPRYEEAAKYARDSDSERKSAILEQCYFRLGEFNFTQKNFAAALDYYLLLRGLFITSFLLEDFLREQRHFDSRQVVIVSASSKTAIALAHCLRRSSSVEVVGLTSANNVEFVRGLGEYHRVISYDELGALPAQASVIVDMAGNSQTLSKIYSVLNGNVKHCASVGATHWDAPRHGVTIPEPKPQFFFAPSQLAKRGKDLGREVLNSRISDALSVFVDSTQSWLKIRHIVGSSAITDLYTALVNGAVAPEDGNIVSFE